jgi:hypothetical protein
MMLEIGASSPLAGGIVASYTRALNDMRGWSALSADMARAIARA